MKRALTEKKDQFYLIALLISLSLAFWLRWQFVHNINLYPDEFVTLLAMEMIGKKGVPVLPSGLFYEHGLLYSYLAGGAALLGDPALLGRLTSLGLGLATIVLTYWLGRRWFSQGVGLLAAVGLSLAPAAIHWSGRVRMYALLQFLVLLTLWFMLAALYRNQANAAWLAVLAYSGALLTQFVSLILLPPITLAEIIALQTRPDKRRWFADPKIWLRGLAVGGAVLIAFFFKRAGQPKGIEPLQTSNAIAGIWQILTIYTSFSPEIKQSWGAVSAFFVDRPVMVYTVFAPVAIGAALYPGATNRRPGSAEEWREFRYGPALFLAVILLLTTVETLLFAPPDRRDEKYLFMLLPVLLLLGAQGMMEVVNWVGARLRQATRTWYEAAVLVLIALSLSFLSYSKISKLLTTIGEDYATTFAYVSAHRQPDDVILTATPAAAYYYLGGNDYYAVQSGGPYDYRILHSPQGPVERWLGSPWIQTPQALNNLFVERPVWLVLERWGLLVQYYQPFFMQNILAQTEFIREDNGIIALKSLPEPQLLRETPAVPGDSILAGIEGDPGRLRLRGYTLEGKRLTLYWEAVVPLAFDYTVFVNVRNKAGETILQTDHRPLGSIYPTTLWPPGQLIRETSQLSLSPGEYELRVGMYFLETGERLWVPDDETLQNMVYLGEFQVP